MLQPAVRLAAVFLGVSVITVSTGSSAQERGAPGGVRPRGRGRAAARPAGPPPGMARPAAPPPMTARPAAPSFRAAPPSQRPAMVPQAAPRVAAPSRPAPPSVIAPGPEIHRAGPPQRPAMTRHPEPRIAAPSNPTYRPLWVRDRRERNRSKRGRRRVSSASSSDSKLYRSGSVTCCRARAQSVSTASIACSSACNNCSRKSQKVSGRNERRKGCCRHKNRLLQREQRLQQSDQARLQQLGRGLQLERPRPPPPLCRLPHAGDLPRTSAAMMLLRPKRRSTARERAGLPAMPGGAGTARRLWLGSARCSGPTPIPTSSNTRSGLPPTTPAIGLTLTTTSSTRCTGVRIILIPLTPDIRNLASVINGFSSARTRQREPADCPAIVWKSG